MPIQKINLSLEPHENCTSFKECSTNKCPLHKNHSKLQDYPEDKAIKGWKKCRANKLIRMRIAKAFRLKTLGLTDKERGNLTKSLQMKKQIFLTQRKQPKTPLNAHSGTKSESALVPENQKARSDNSLNIQIKGSDGYGMQFM